MSKIIEKEFAKPDPPPQTGSTSNVKPLATKVMPCQNTPKKYTRKRPLPTASPGAKKLPNKKQPSPRKTPVEKIPKKPRTPLVGGKLAATNAPRKAQASKSPKKIPNPTATSQKKPATKPAAQAIPPVAGTECQPQSSSSIGVKMIVRDNKILYKR